MSTFLKFSNNKSQKSVHWDSDCSLETDRRMDRHDGTNIDFSQLLYECAYICMEKNLMKYRSKFIRNSEWSVSPE